MRKKCGKNAAKITPNTDTFYAVEISTNYYQDRSTYKYQTVIVNVLIVNAKQLDGRKKPFRCFIQEQGRSILLVVAKFILSLQVNIKQLTETRMIAPYLNHASLALIYF